MTDLTDDELLEALGVTVEAESSDGHTAREERIIAGFEEIQRFVETNGRQPLHGDGRDIFERLYAVRLERIRALREAKELLTSIDYQGLLSESKERAAKEIEALSDDELLAELDASMSDEDDITVLKHVKSRSEIRAADDVAKRTACSDFDEFRPLFQQVESDLSAGRRQTRRFGKDTSIGVGDFFVLSGQLAYVAERGEDLKAPNGGTSARLRVIYSNGTQSNLLLWSLQRALYKDEGGRRVTDPDMGPLFSDVWEDDDTPSGTIYVLRSQSSHPFIAEHRELIHKIGVTGGTVESRVADAVHDATYLLAEVEVVATYKLADINRSKLENLFHRIFAPAQLDLTITDRFGNPVRPREWFLVPLHVIDEAVTRIRDGSITQMVYDPKTARLEGRS